MEFKRNDRVSPTSAPSTLESGGHLALKTVVRTAVNENAHMEMVHKFLTRMQKYVSSALQKWHHQEEWSFMLSDF